MADNDAPIPPIDDPADHADAWASARALAIADFDEDENKDWDQPWHMQYDQYVRLHTTKPQPRSSTEGVRGNRIDPHRWSCACGTSNMPHRTTCDNCHRPRTPTR